MSHTPGPWQVFNGVRDEVHLPQYQRKDSCRVILDQDRMAIAEMRMGNPEANARLIAAAPELLEALIAIETEVRAYGELYTEGGAADKEWKKALKFAQVVIAKATGGAK